MDDNIKFLWGAFCGFIVVSVALLVVAILNRPTPYEILVRHITTCEQCSKEPGGPDSALCSVGFELLQSIMKEGEG